jgi:hypothetical protein
MVIVFELPFVIDETDIKKFFAKVAGGVKSLEVYRSGALVFSTAIIELNQKKGVKKAIELAESGSISGEFDVILMSASEFLAGKKIPRKNKNGQQMPTTETKEKKPCKVQ